MSFDAVLTAVVGDLTDQLTAALEPHPTVFCGLYPGPAAIADFCRGCRTPTPRPGVRPATPQPQGMAWVRVDRVYPSGQSFPSVDSRPTCDSPLAAVIEVGVWRCQPVPNPQGQMDPAALIDAALTQTRDAAALHTALRAAHQVTRRPHVLGTYLPSASGDCGGGAWPVTVKLLAR